MCFFGSFNNTFNGQLGHPDYKFGKLCIYKNHQVRVLEDQDQLLLLTGSIFDCSDQMLLSSLKLLESAYGTFAYVHVNKRTYTVTIGTDKLGFHSLFYYQKGSVLMFGLYLPHLKYRLNNIEPNYEAIEDSLNSGDIIGCHTIIKDVFRLRQGEKIVIENEKISLKEFWRYEPVPLVKLDHFIKENNELLNEALLKTKSWNNCRVLPLTGGQDSRRLALAAKFNQIRVDTITQQWPGPEGFDTDSPIAAQIASMLDLPHKNIAMADHDQLLKDIYTRDYWLGYESKDHVWSVQMARHIEKPSLILDGIIGDLATNGHYFMTMPEYTNIYKNLDRVVDLFVLRNKAFNFRKQYINQSMWERVYEEINRYPADHNRFSLFKIFNHGRRNTGSWLQIFHLNDHQTCLPFCYHPLFIQSLSLDPAERKGRYIKTLCMEKYNSAVATLPSTRDKLENWHIKQFNMKKLDCEVSYPDSMCINKLVFRTLETSIKHQAIDLFNSLCGNIVTKNNYQWRYAGIRRLSLMLNWLKTDESHLPVLFMGQPEFIDSLISDTLSNQ